MISQDDLNALFEDIQIEARESTKTIEIKNVKSLDGKEILSQDQIDDLLKAFLND